MKPFENIIISIDEINKNAVESAALNQYIAFKEQNPDSIILMQIGSFYEALFEDAKILSEDLGLTLSSRQFRGVGRVAQAGVHIDNVDIYIKQLLNKNYKVCLYLEYSDLNGNRIRKLARKYTKGTIIENEFLDSFENNYILALYKNENFYYLSYADVSTGQFYKTKSEDFEQILSEVDKISPDELLISRRQTDLFKEICLKFSTTLIDDRYFKSHEIDDVILKYCKNVQQDFAVKLNNVVEYKINEFLLMDEITRFNLELTRTKRSLKKKGSVFWFLNYTKTPMGSRYLKKVINEPLLSIDLIKERQDAVAELIEKKDNFNRLDEILSKLSDLSRICAGISNTTIMPKDLFTIVDNFKNIEALNEILSDYSSPLIKLDLKNFSKILELAQLIEAAVKPDASNDLKSGNIINDGFDNSLDDLRKQNAEIDDEISDYELSQKQKLKIENLKIRYSGQNGYFIEIPKSKEYLINFGYYKKNSSNTVSRFTSDRLKELETLKNNIQYQINQLEYDLFCSIRRKAILFVEVVRLIAIDLARLDVLFSFAKCAVLNNLTRPKFNNEIFEIKNGFHPSLLKLNNEISKNDTSIKSGQVYVITGANMSGKSTYLKHNAIIALLAQIGSYVPADLADIQICDKIFLRQGINDDLVNNNSSFMVEMNDLKLIIDNVTKNSLVLLDEPAKSTSGIEGGAIARAYTEFLMLNKKPKTIIVTHNPELTKIQNQYPDYATNWLMGYDSSNPSRKLRRGCADSSNALDTARLAQLPEEVIELAEKYILN